MASRVFMKQGLMKGEKQKNGVNNENFRWDVPVSHNCRCKRTDRSCNSATS